LAYSLVQLTFITILIFTLFSFRVGSLRGTDGRTDEQTDGRTDEQDT